MMIIKFQHRGLGTGIGASERLDNEDVILALKDGTWDINTLNKRHTRFSVRRVYFHLVSYLSAPTVCICAKYFSVCVSTTPDSMRTI